MSSENIQEAPTGEFRDDSYVSRPGNKNEPVSVQPDHEVDDPINPATADTDQQLERDDKEAIDRNNIIDERTRNAAKPSGAYQEPGDDEGIPADNGISSLD